MQNESDSQPTTGGKEEKLVKQGKENNMNATNPVTLKGYFTTIKGIAPAKPQPTLKPAKPSTPQKTYTQVTLAHIFKLPTKEKEVAIVPDTPSTMKRASKIKKSKKPAIIDQTEQKGQESTQAIHPRRKRKYDDVLAQVQVLDGEGNGTATSTPEKDPPGSSSSPDAPVSTAPTRRSARLKMNLTGRPTSIDVFGSMHSGQADVLHAQPAKKPQPTSMPQVVKIDEGEDSNHKGDSIHKRLAMRELTGCRARLVPAVIKELDYQIANICSGHDHATYTMSFNESGSLLAVGGGNGKISIFPTHSLNQSLKDIPLSVLLESKVEGVHKSCSHSLVAHARWVSCVQFSSYSPTRLYSSSDDGSIGLWDINDDHGQYQINNKPLAQAYPTCHGIYSLHEVNGNVLTSYKDGTIRQHTVTGTALHSERTLHGYHSSVAKCVRARDDQAHIFASCGNDKLISIPDFLSP